MWSPAKENIFGQKTGVVPGVELTSCSEGLGSIEIVERARNLDQEQLKLI